MYFSCNILCYIRTLYCTHELSGPEVTINGCDCKNCSPDTEPLCEFLRMVDSLFLSKSHTAMCPTELPVATVLVPSGCV